MDETLRELVSRYVDGDLDDAEAARLEVPFLGEIPLHAAIRSGGDSGDPVAAADPHSEHSEAFLALASLVRDKLATRENAASGGA